MSSLEIESTLPAGLHEQVNLLATMAAEFANTLNVNETLLLAVEEITRFLKAEGGAVFLLDEETEKITCIACFGATEITGLELSIGQGIVGKSIANNAGALVRDVKNDPDFFSKVDQDTGFTTRSILCAPMSVKDKCVGAIELVNKQKTDDLFDELDLKVLETLAASAALSVINARMAKALVEQERVKRELELAADIQRRFLPDASQNKHLPIAGVNKPARGVSGDFYDYFPLADGRICFALGDVSGKGINASLLMAKTASLFRCLGKSERNPGKLLGKINAELCETAAHGMFVTMVAGLYDPRPGCRGLIRLANAGHEPVVLYRDGHFESYEAEGPPLGILPPLDEQTQAYPEVEIYPDGGTLYIYTDGLTEGYMENGAPLETEGVRTILIQSHAFGLTERLDRLVAAVAHQGVPLRDDVTVLALSDENRTEDQPNLVQERDQQSTLLSDGEALINFNFKAEPVWMKLARACVREACLKCGCLEEVAADVVLAVDEACQNVIRHAYGGPCDHDIELDIRYRPGRLVFRLRDFAALVEPGKIKPRALDDIRPGGLGTHLINEVMDEVHYLRPIQGEGNLLKMVKNISST